MKYFLLILSFLIISVISAEDYGNKRLQNIINEIKKHEKYSPPRKKLHVESLYCSEKNNKKLKVISDKAEVVTLGLITDVISKDKVTKQDPFSKKYTIFFEPLLTWKGIPEAPFHINVTTGVSSFDLTVEKGESYLLFLERKNKRVSKNNYVSVCKAPFDSLSDQKRIDIVNEILNNKT